MFAIGRSFVRFAPITVKTGKSEIFERIILIRDNVVNRKNGHTASVRLCGNIRRENVRGGELVRAHLRAFYETLSFSSELFSDRLRVRRLRKLK